MADTAYKYEQSWEEMKRMAEELIDGAEHSAAREILREMSATSDEKEREQLYVFLRIAECDVTVNGIIRPETDERILRCLENSNMSYQDVKKMATQEKPPAATILFLYACKLLRVRVQPNDSLKQINSCVGSSQNAIRKMARQPDLVTKASKLIILMHEMLKQIRDVKDANQDLKILTEATCLNKIGVLYSQLRANKAIKFLKEGREVMKNHFGSSSSRYSVYASLANNIGSTHSKLRDYSDAATCRAQAMSDLREATDVNEAVQADRLKNYRDCFVKSLAEVAKTNPEEAASLEQRYAPVIRSERSREIQRPAFAAKAEVDVSRPQTPREGQAKLIKKNKPRPQNPSENNKGDPDSFHEVQRKIKERMKLKTSAEELIKNSEYSDAREIFRQLLVSIDENEKQLNVLLQIAECDIMANGNINSNTDREIIKVIESMGVSGHEVQEMAAQLKRSAKIILSFCACKLIRVQVQPDEAVRSIEILLAHSKVEVGEMLEEPDLKKMGIGLMTIMRGMLEQLRGIVDADEDLKIRAEAKSLATLGFLYNNIPRPRTALNFLNEGRRKLSSRFSSKAPKSFVYSALANNIGCSHALSHNFSDAAIFHAKAFIEMRQADDVAEKFKLEQMTNFKEAFEFDLAITEGTEPEKAREIRENYAWQVLFEKPEKNEEQRFFQALKSDESEGSHVYTGNGIFVDHTKRLSENHAVYRGKLGDEDVAVKEIEFSEERKQEIEIMTEIKEHPNTVQYKMSSIWESAPGFKLICIAMELCGEKTLCELIEARSLSDEDRKHALLQVTHGLKHIHDSSIIHGDLKPTNILRSFDEHDLKVADFGLSRKLDEDKSCITFDNNGNSDYRWQPQDAKMSKKFDIYSLGLVYHYVLSEGNLTPSQDGGIIDLDVLTCPDVEAAKNLILRMLDKDPEKRPLTDEILEHPYFWNTEKKFHLYCDFSDLVQAAGGQLEVAKNLNANNQDIIRDSWLKRLDFTEMAEQTNMPSYDESGMITSALRNKAEADGHNGKSTSSLLRFIGDCYREFRGDQLQSSVGSQDALWKFFDVRFPKLFLTVHTLAAEHGLLWTEARQFKFLCEIPKYNLASSYEEKESKVFGKNWMEMLILDKEEKSQIQQKIKDAGGRLKISRSAIYNKALVNERQDELDYDGKSLPSLLRFIKNRNAHFSEDEKQVQIIFNGDITGMRKFFLSRFPNLFDEVYSDVHRVNSPDYHLLLLEVFSPDVNPGGSNGPDCK